MPDGRAQRTHAIFMRALDVETSERAAFVVEACAGDPQMRERVERLIAALGRSGDYLEVPALGVRAVPPIPDARRVIVRGYRVVGVIGAGGMATVYEAIQEQPERKVALKVMSRAFASASAARRFRYETEVLAKLQHQGIAQIHEAGMCEDGEGHPAPFFAMEFIEGARTITAHVLAEGVSLRARLEMFAGVCDAVQHAHQLGVIHRDLKPGNILVGSDGRCRVIDFGVARSTEGDHRITMHTDAGQLIGTLNFMSPEQCEGHGAVDVRADVYSLGVVLYELISGRQPYDLSGVALPAAIRIIREEAPARLGRLAPEALGDLEAIVNKAMAKDPEERYASAGMLAADIRRYLDHQPVEASPPTMVRSAVLFARRHRVLVGAAGAIAVIVVAASMAVSVLGFRAAQESRRRAEAERVALAERDTARRQAYIASVGGAFASLQLGESVQARRRLALAPMELRNFEWSLASALTERGETVIKAHDDLIFAFASTPDGSRVATGTRLGSLAVWDVASGSQLMHIQESPGGTIYSLELSVDGRRVYSGSQDGSIREWDVERGAQVGEVGRHGSAVMKLARGNEGVLASASNAGEASLWNIATGTRLRDLEQPGGVRGVSFAHDGSRLMTWGAGGSIVVRDGSGAPLRPPLEFEGVVEAIALSPDGGILAAGGEEGRIVIWDVPDGDVRHELETPPWNRTVRALAFTPDGRWLASGQAQVLFWDVSTGERGIQLAGHEDAVSGIAFVPGTDRVVSSSWDGTIRVWQVDTSLSSSPLLTLAGHENDVLGAAFAADGELLASGGRDDLVRIWEPRLGTMLAVLPGHDGDVYSVSFSPDGRMLASASEDGTVRLWRTDGDGEEAVLAVAGHGAGILWSLAYSPDGMRIAAAGEQGVVRVWDVRSRTVAMEFRAHDQRVVQLAYSPDGRTIATASRDGTARLWDAGSGSLLHTLGGTGGGAGGVRGHKADVFAVVFSRDGTRVYTGSRDRTVGVWDRASGGLIESLDAQGHFVTSLSISPDGSRLVAGTWFGEALVWDLATHDLVASFKAYNSAIRTIQFSPDGRELVCGGHDHTLHVYNTRPRAELVQQRERERAAMAAARSRLESGIGGSSASGTAMTEDDAADPEIARWLRHLRLMQRAPGGQ